MRLSAANLGLIPCAIARPGYDRDARGIGIVHFGIGAFHRAHMAAYTDDAMSAQQGDWRILGVSLRSPTVRDQMSAQDALYSLIERSAAGNKMRVIGAVADVIVATDDRGLWFPGLRCRAGMNQVGFESGVLDAKLRRRHHWGGS